MRIIQQTDSGKRESCSPDSAVVLSGEYVLTLALCHDLLKVDCDLEIRRVQRVRLRSSTLGYISLSVI